MHLELPRVRIHSLKDFIKHYLMIVLSILTALGLEAWIEHAHHAHAAEAASRPIPGAHSIWELVLHVAGWADVARARLTSGEPVVPAED